MNHHINPLIQSDMEVVNHLLKGENIKYDSTTKVSGQYVPDSIIIHYTAGDSTDVAVKTLKNPAIKASAHIVVGMDGEIVQLAPLNIITWHAGQSEYKGRVGYNKYSIGIEISNPGYLMKQPDGSFHTWYNKKIDPSLIVEANHRNKITTVKHWHKYPEVQINRVYEICEAICAAYDIQQILGHEEIAPGRKTDPGPAFPLDALRDKLLNQNNSTFPPAALAVVNADMKVLKDAKADSEALWNLTAGTNLKPIKVQGDWLKVAFRKEGWVMREFLVGDNTDDDGDAVVTANRLNMRSGPTKENDVLMVLVKGDKVNLIEQNNGWYKIWIEDRGFVANNMVTMQNA